MPGTCRRTRLRQESPEKAGFQPTRLAPGASDEGGEFSELDLIVLKGSYRLSSPQDLLQRNHRNRGSRETGALSSRVVLVERRLTALGESSTEESCLFHGVACQGQVASREMVVGRRKTVVPGLCQGTWTLRSRHRD